MAEIRTERLRLVPLTMDRLRSHTSGPGDVERQLELEVSRDIDTDRLRRAIEMKVAKMERVDLSEHAWYICWQTLVEEQHLGAGLANSEGSPNERGEIEIGYGIDSAFRIRGYVPEAVRGLIAWAFQDERCRAIIAPDTKRWNGASNRVLEKTGKRVYNETEEALDWRVEKGINEPQHVAGAGAVRGGYPLVGDVRGHSINQSAVLATRRRFQALGVMIFRYVREGLSTIGCA